MEFRQSKISGCYEIKADIFRDPRGIFVKTFREDLCAKHGVRMSLAEQYFSVSKRGVIRGLHFQVPPFDQNKLVTCVSGKVFDVVVDLRRGSPTYGKFETFELDSEKGSVLFVPKGLAHGFQALSEGATLYYQVSTVYSAENDRGVRWDTAGVPWPIENPVLSERDGKFPALSEFQSPF
ncbi:MAG: dTDP-4-dehydrorhamnose 3,5-epimerase [Deltaproteobacteria bacterium]|nr:dTDP-4-dehydrorhamnose 3,5-epimerase [Deltaproteobacteria bacterium]